MESVFVISSTEAHAAEADRSAQRITWSSLDPTAKAVRTGHVVIAVGGLISLAYVWVCALTGHRDHWLAAACAALSLQGVAVLLGRGNCPLGQFQRRLGDPTPCFELVLPPRVAKAAFPVLLPIAVAGIALVGIRTWSSLTRAS